MEKKQFKGTQGEWHIGQHGGIGVQIGCGQSHYVACAYTGGRDRCADEPLANAQLIATAPELLELLIDIIKDSEFVIESARGASYYHDCNIDIEDLEVLIKKAKETVNKALGI
ncbi:hypothetical protein [Dysgonomonas sp. GY617]|uniref:hypothetical protein n=1 Tax=Dysgonomonas sp. GY617 TaxID=2780420 RepID=UPI0018844B53|nr:hypothetical protein [Dysgonomonas sp. GY617]MBF0577720.1 hypothetical protein [Dysgonomonas sp. GY617]